jgi:hypothetical protein
MDKLSIILLICIGCLVVYIVIDKRRDNISNIDNIREALISKGLPTPAFASKKELQSILDKYS